MLGVDCGDGGEDVGGDGIGGVGDGLGELEQLETSIAIAIVRASDRSFLRLIIMTPAPDLHLSRSSTDLQDIEQELSTV